jgi:hypothetical protein
VINKEPDGSMAIRQVPIKPLTGAQKTIIEENA